MNLKLHMIILKAISLLLINCLLLPNGMSTALQTAQATSMESVQMTELAKAVKQWKNQLSSQSNFKAWQDATHHIHPLGPGTHGWVVLIQLKQEVIGYMIVYAKEQGGFSLAEYGVGDLHSLKQNLSSLTYYGPFHTVFTGADKKGRIVYIDPFLDEQLPLTKQQLTKQAEATQVGLSTSKLPALLTNALAIDYFAPYDLMPWLTGEDLNYAFEDDTSVETLIELGSPLRYITESWNHTIVIAYSVTGYHEWNEIELFLSLQGDNEHVRRYIQYDLLMEQGKFYDETDY